MDGIKDFQTSVTAPISSLVACAGLDERSLCQVIMKSQNDTAGALEMSVGVHVCGVFTHKESTEVGVMGMEEKLFGFLTTCHECALN